jgi:hypothetical protein
MLFKVSKELELYVEAEDAGEAAARAEEVQLLAWHWSETHVRETLLDPEDNPHIQKHLNYFKSND